MMAETCVTNRRASFISLNRLPNLGLVASYGNQNINSNSEVDLASFLFLSKQIMTSCTTEFIPKIMITETKLIGKIIRRCSPDVSTLNLPDARNITKRRWGKKI